MKFAISHIAWDLSDEDFFLKQIKEFGCDGIEIAPNKIWVEPINVSHEKLKEYRHKISDFGLEICAIQALFYTRRDLNLFENFDKTLVYTQKLCEVASGLGAPFLVFGSPKSRWRGQIEKPKALEIAVKFFEIVANTAQDCNVCMCIEHLSNTEADFVTSIEEGAELVSLVDNLQGFGLHLDSKAIAIEQENLADLFPKVKPLVKHYHISEPKLDEINSSKIVPHQEYANVLRKEDYQGYVSIEMKTLPNNREVIQRSLQYSKNTYLS